MKPETIDDLFLILALVLILWGFLDPTKLVLILAGVLVMFVIIKGEDDDAGKKSEE